MIDISSLRAVDQSPLAVDTSAVWTTDNAVDADGTDAPAPASTDAVALGQGWTPSSDATAPPATASTADSVLTAVERGFSALTGMLQREFGALEQRFAGAMRSLFGAASGAVASAGDASRPSVSSGAPVQGPTGGGAPSPYDGLIRRAAARNQVDPALVKAVMRQESDFQPAARSKAGALGLMQLMPQTAASLGVSDPLDPSQNVDGGTRLLRSLLDRFGGKVDLAVAAYNAGSGAVERYGGVPPYPETQAYVRNVLADYRAGALGASS